VRRLLLLGGVSILLAACGGGGSDAAPTTAATIAPAAATTAPVAATTSGATNAGGGVIAVPNADGHQTAVMSDGTKIAYTLVLPTGFDATKTYPLLLALPPGGQDQETTDAVVDRVWKDEAKRRGWVVVSPVAPGALFYEPDSAKYVPELVQQMKTMFHAEGGKVHLAGVSNGGLSAYRAALDHPELYLDLLTFPGMPPEQGDDVAKLKDLPAADWVGELDSGWREAGEATIAKLQSLGDDAQITVVPGESHILESVGGGDYLAWLDRHRPAH
jgi:pimeloyl-ACP methyl ester carboxylesterase